MSVNKYDSTTGQLTTLADGTRVWIGTQSAHDLSVQNGTMPNNCMVCITDDYPSDGTDDYSTEETKTFKHWIDGKPIYRIVASITNPSWDGNNDTINIDLSGVETLTSIPYATNGKAIRSFRVSSINSSNRPVVVGSDISGFGNGTTVSVVFEYTKKTN